MSDFIDDEMIDEFMRAFETRYDWHVRKGLNAVLPIIGAKLAKEGDTLKRAIPVDDIITRVNEPARASECDAYDEGIEDFAARIRDLTGAKT